MALAPLRTSPVYGVRVSTTLRERPSAQRCEQSKAHSRPAQLLAGGHGVACEKSLVASADVRDPSDRMDDVLRQQVPETCRFRGLLPFHKPHPEEERGGRGSADRLGQQGRACTRRAGTQVEDPRQRVAGPAGPDQRQSDPHTPCGSRIKQTSSRRRRDGKQPDQCKIYLIIWPQLVSK